MNTVTNKQWKVYKTEKTDYTKAIQDKTKSKSGKIVTFLTARRLMY